MRYICQRHQWTLSQSPECAQQTWTMLYKQGRQLVRQKEWQLAEKSFGGAYEIALILQDQNQTVDADEMGHLAPFECLDYAIDGLAGCLEKRGQATLAKNYRSLLMKQLTGNQLSSNDSFQIMPKAAVCH